MSAKGTARRWMLPAIGGALVALVVIGVVLQGPAAFSPPRVLLPDVTVTAPPRSEQPATGTSAPRERGDALQVDLSWVVVGLAVVALVIGLALLWRYLRRRLRVRAEQPVPALATVTSGDLPEPPEEAPRPEPVRRGLDRALDVLRDDRDPRDAIERAWVGLEEGAADSGVRRLPAETPGEFVARVLARVGADRVAARRLLDVYLRVRFGDRPVTATDIGVAREALEAVRASWADATAPGAGSSPSPGSSGGSAAGASGGGR